MPPISAEFWQDLAANAAKIESREFGRRLVELLNEVDF
jgi:hypothetical protein